MMKRFLFSAGTWIIAWWALPAGAQVTLSKEVSKTYTVPEDGKVTIGNKYGDVHIETWNQQQVTLQVQIKVTRRSESKARDMLGRIGVNILDSYAADLTFITEFDGSLDLRGSEKIEVDYRLRVPVTHDLSITNRYGNLYLARNTGNVDITVKYGSIKITDMEGTADITLAYGNGTIDKLAAGSLTVSYSDLSLTEAGNIRVYNAYSDIDFDRAGSVRIENKYGDNHWHRLHSLRGESKYGNLKIDRLYEDLRVDVTYGGGVKVYWIASSFTLIDVEARYASVLLEFEPGMAATLDAEFRYGSLKNEDLEFDHTYINKSNTGSQYRGRLGRGEPRSKIRIEAAYGSATLRYAE